MTIPDDIVIYNEPGFHVFHYPEWARWAIVTIQAGHGGAGRSADGTITPGQPGGKVTFAVRVTKAMVPMEIGAAGRDWDGVARSPSGFVMLELFRERPSETLV